MANLQITRKLGERRAVSVEVTYPSAYDLSTATIKFWMDAADGTPIISGAAATPTDISPVSAPQTVWKLSYAFDADDLTALGMYTGEFEVDFGGGLKEYYPTKRDVILVNVIEHPASTA